MTAAIIIAVIYISCRPSYSSPPPTPASTIQGKWNILTVTTLAYDAGGQPWAGGSNIYTPPPGTFFEFDANGRWTESLSPDSLPFVTQRGTYTVASSTQFTYSDSLGHHTDCLIDTLTTSLFVFNHQKNTLFNGVTPGTLKYVFRMTK